MSSSGVETIIGNLPKQKTFTVISLFESGIVDYDNNIAFINLNYRHMNVEFNTYNLIYPFEKTFNIISSILGNILIQ